MLSQPVALQDLSPQCVEPRSTHLQDAVVKGGARYLAGTPLIPTAMLLYIQIYLRQMKMQLAV